MDYKIEINKEELPFIREKLMKCKIIALNSMDKHPLMNPKYFPKSQRDLLLKKIRELFDTKTQEEIDIEFNLICNEKLFDSGIDYADYPIYIDDKCPNQQEKIDLEEEDFNKLKEKLAEAKAKAEAEAEGKQQLNV
jgi:hypothetical protein